MSKNRNRPNEQAGAQPQACDVIDPAAPVDFGAFEGTDNDALDLDEVSDAGANSVDAGAALEQQPGAKATGAIEPDVVAASATTTVGQDEPRSAPRKKLAVDKTLQLATEIANEAKRKPLVTVEDLIAFHGFVVEKIDHAYGAQG